MGEGIEGERDEGEEKERIGRGEREERERTRRVEGEERVCCGRECEVGKGRERDGETS